MNWNLVKMDSEARVRDVDLATNLGFERPRDVRKLIERIMPEIERLGTRATVAQTHGKAGGRPGTEIRHVLATVLFVLALAVSNFAHADEALVLKMSLYKAPKHDRAELQLFASAVSRVVGERGPLFAGTDGPERTEALIASIAFFESSYQLGAVGDGGNSLCWGQVQKAQWGSLVLTDPFACVVAIHTMIADSVRRCPVHPIAIYAGGNIGCELERAKRISTHRMYWARKMLAHAKGLN
jgi:hypothetical protein